MPKNTNKTKNTETNFDLTTDSLIENIKLFQLSLKSVFFNILPKFYSESLNQNTLFDRTHSNLTWFFYQKELKYFNDFQNRNFSVVWLKWTKPWKWNKISHFLMGHIQSHVIYFLSKNIKLFQWLLKSKFLSCMTKVNLNNGNVTKSDIFDETYSNLTSFFIDRKILKYFNDVHNWHLSTSSQKWAQPNKVK